MGEEQILQIAESDLGTGCCECGSTASWTSGASSARRRLTDAGIVFGPRDEALAELTVIN